MSAGAGDVSRILMASNIAALPLKEGCLLPIHRLGSFQKISEVLKAAVPDHSILIALSSCHLGGQT
jgi:hypothetical protein